MRKNHFVNMTVVIVNDVENHETINFLIQIVNEAYKIVEINFLFT